MKAALELPALWLGRALWAVGACICWLGMWLMPDEEPEDADAYEIVAEWIDDEEDE